MAIRTIFSGLLFMTITIGLSTSTDLAAGKPDDDSTRIVGGYPAKEGEFPWQVGIWRKRSIRPFCGGSLIANKWVMTAAHCLWRKKMSDLEVVLGDLDVRKTESTEQRHAVCSLKIHEKYSKSKIEHDIALMELCEPAVIGNNVQIVPLAPMTLELDHPQETIVSGWGTTQEGGKTSAVLMAVKVNTTTKNQCRKSYKFVTDYQICAGIYGKGGQDSCQGDSGGPLVWKNPETGSLIQVGVVSSGKGCARAKYPGIYTNVGKYLEWILEKMSEM